MVIDDATHRRSRRAHIDVLDEFSECGAETTGSPGPEKTIDWIGAALARSHPFVNGVERFAWSQSSQKTRFDGVPSESQKPASGALASGALASDVVPSTVVLASTMLLGESAEPLSGVRGGPLSRPDVLTASSHAVSMTAGKQDERRAQGLYDITRRARIASGLRSSREAPLPRDAANTDRGAARAQE